jgi:acetoin utilization deacetylase AcuC-like enzyme
MSMRRHACKDAVAMSGLYFRSSASLEHDTGAHPEGPGRIPAIEAALEKRDWLGLERREAPAVDLEVLGAVHPQRHLERVREMSEKGGGAFDADTVASPGSYNAALHAAGGACALVESLLGGEAQMGFCGLRPPGHHAETATAMGFCLFNNVAVAAQHALDSLGARRVFILDWDVHHGNGTDHIFASASEVLFSSIHQHPLYPGSGRLAEMGDGPGEGYTLNLPVPPGSGEALWLSLLEYIAMPAARQFAPDLVLVSAGFDAHRADPLASCLLETESFREMARHVRVLGEQVGAPVGLMLEGGYDLDALGTSVVATLEGLQDATPPKSVELDHRAELYLPEVHRHWSLGL